MPPPLKKTILFALKWGAQDVGTKTVSICRNICFKPVEYFDLLCSPAIFFTKNMSKVQRPGTKGKNIRKYIDKKWSMLEDGTLVILEEDPEMEGEYQYLATLIPTSVTSDISQAKGEKPGVKLIFTLSDDMKQRLYLASYVPFANSSRTLGNVVEANADNNVGKSLRNA